MVDEPESGRFDPGGAFARYHPALFRYVHRLTGDADVAADIAQEAFVRLLGHPLPEEKVRGWLFTVATNLARDRGRAQKRRVRLLGMEKPSPESPPRPDEDLERRERVAAVRRALGQLATRDRQMLMLRQEGFRYAEIAEIVGVAPGSVGQLLARALARFARVYGSASEGVGERDASRGEV